MNHHQRGTTVTTMTTTTASSGTAGGGSTGTRFRGELHVLCEEARWDEVTRKLKPLLQPPPSSAGGGGGHGPATTSGGGPNPYGLGTPAAPQSHAFRTAPQAHFSSAVSELSLDTTFADMSSVMTPPPAVAARQALMRDRERLAAELLRREGPNEWTPLMISCARAPPEVLAVLVAASPASCLVPDRSGGLPIHFVSGWRRSWWGGSSAPPTEHSLTTGTNPDAAFAQPPHGHHGHPHSQQAIPRNTANNSYRGTDDGDDEDEMKEFCDALRILLAAAPHSVKYRNRWGQTPLHAAFDGGIVPSTDAIRVLLGMDPQDEFLANHRMDRRGSARLSQIEGAIDEHQGEDGVGDETLSSVTKPPTVIGPGVGMTTSVSTHVRDALATADARGRLPLHVAAERGSSNEILSLLVHKYRAAAWTPTHRGNLPVHSLHYYAKKTLHTAGAAAAPKPGLPGTPSSATAIGSTQNDADTVEGSSGSKNRVVDAEAMEILLRPISDADQFRQDDVDDDDDDDQPEADENDVNGKQPQQHSLDVSSLVAPVDIPTSHAQALNWMGQTVDSSWAGRQPTQASVTAATPIPPTTLFPAIADAVLRRRSGGNKRNRLRPREAAMVACRIPGAQKAIHLPLHLAAEYAVSFSVLEGLCNLFPAAVALPHPQLVRTPPPTAADNASSGEALQDSVKVMYPIELFETGLAGAAALAALQSQKRLTAMGNATEDVSSSLHRLGEIMRQFVDRSDLLFSFFPFAVPSQYGKRPANGSSRRQRKVVKLYRRDPDRLVRLEKKIRSQAADVSRKELTPVALRIWTFMCRYYANEADKKDSYRTHVGRVISGLHDDALWKLSFAASASGEQELIVLPEPSGRTIKNEATERAPTATMDGELLEEKPWQAVLISFLSSVDALSWSATCRRSRSAGVRLVATEMELRQSSGYWEFPPYDNSNMSYRWWQRIEPVVSPAITHSVIVSFRLELQYSRQAVQQHPRGFRPGVDGGGGGLVVVCDGIDPNGNSIPMVVSEQVAPSTPTPSSLVTDVKLAYRHLPGQSYSLWHYGPHVGGRVAVSGIRLRQLLLGPDPRTNMSRSNSPVFSGVRDDKSFKMMQKLQQQQQQPHKQQMTIQPLPLHHATPHGAVASVAQSRSTAASPGNKRGGTVGESRLHHALRAGFAEDALAKLIASKPAILMETDEEGLTPLHAAFLLESDEPPSFSVVRTLLSTPGENAAKLKDSYGRLPLHIAAERGAGENILTLLVTAYADACYRQNKDGDLPVHLLVRSGAATTATVELLLKPIMRSETICRLGGSQGVMLPLHIAAEYRCSFTVLERLLQTYGEAASQPRVLKHEDEDDNDEEGGGSSKRSRSKRSSGNEDDDEDDDEEGSQVTSVPLYALDIFELQRDRVLGRENSVQRAMTRGNPSRREMRELGPLSDMVGAEYNLRSDLLFVHNPFLIAPLTDTPYRRDEERIERLQKLIRREALVAAEMLKGDGNGTVAAAELSDVAKLAWCFFCTFASAVNAKDHYTDVVRRILRGLPTAAAHVLACVPNPHSNYQPLSVSATPQCVQLILSRSRFVGRYAFLEDEFPLYKTDSTLVVKSRDYGAVPEFERLKGLLLAEKDDLDIDLEDEETKSNDGTAASSTTNNDDKLMAAFLAFARFLGVGEEEARAELRSHVVEGSGGMGDGMGADVGLEHSRGDADVDEQHQRSRSALSLETFLAFCKACRLDDNGVRNVIIKLLTDRVQYQWELRGRLRLRLDDTEWPVVPVWAHYDADRARERERDAGLLREDEEKLDEDPHIMFARDVHEGSFSSQNLSLFRYALVMPCHDSDLFQLSIRQELDILRIRDCMLQVARSVKAIHSENMIHGNLHMGNIVCFGGSIALTELGCSRSIPGRGSKGRKEYVGGASCGTRTASVPPEMITRIEQGAGYRELSQLEQYWKSVSDDAKDLKLLTPDDIHTITAVVTSLLGQWRTLEASTSSAGSSSSLFSTGGPKSRATLESAQKAVQDWKEELSGALVTISFEDLPSSLTCCETLEQFGSVWERLRENARLWEKVKPRFFSSSGYAYVLKTFDDREGGNNGSGAPGVQGLPYEPVVPNEKVDVWAFGVLLYNLCSGSNLFHVGYRDDLRDAASFAALYGWSRKKAQAIIFDNVADPLAQDLLLHLLVPEADRLENMDMVLQHPFFGPFSSADAQRILEKHEEQQLIIEETVVISIMTAKTQRKLQRSTEARCKVIFEEDKIVIPTAFVVLPYELRWDPAAAAFVIPSDNSVFEMASEVGRFLLQINKATARLSFWTTMKKRLSKKNGGDIKSKMKVWLSRARSDTSDVVARDMLESIGCATEYTSLCVEMLEKSENVSSARSYIKDPMAAAYRAIKDSTDGLVRLYRKNFFYLVDEYQGVPVLSSRSGGEDAAPYPVKIDPGASSAFLQHLFLPFMHIVVMSLTSDEGLIGLARVLGIPRSHGIPDSWNEAELGLVHRAGNVSSIEEFGILQKKLRRYDPKAAKAAAKTAQNNGGGGEFFSLDDDVALLENESAAESLEHGAGSTEMRDLEVFFREFDPMRLFADLRRVTDGNENSPAMWTTVEMVSKIQGEMEMASVEARMEELRGEMARRDTLADEMARLTARYKTMRTGSVSSAASGSNNSMVLVDPRRDGTMSTDSQSASSGLDHSQQQHHEQQFPFHDSGGSNSIYGGDYVYAGPQSGSSPPESRGPGVRRPRLRQGKGWRTRIRPFFN